MHKDAKHWAAKDSITGKGGYFTCRSREQPVMYLAVYDDGYFKGHEAPAVGGGPKPVSWAGDVDGLGYFLRTDESKWQIYTDPSGSAVALSQLEEIQRLHGIPNMDFDARLRFILYGQSARIYVLTDCFHTEFRDDVYTEDHPLYKASSESRRRPSFAPLTLRFFRLYPSIRVPDGRSTKARHSAYTTTTTFCSSSSAPMPQAWSPRFRYESACLSPSPLLCNKCWQCRGRWTNVMVCAVQSRSCAQHSSLRRSDGGRDDDVQEHGSWPFHR